MDKENMVKFAKDNAIDLVFVAPDDPLADGMVDAMQAAGIRAFGLMQMPLLLRRQRFSQKSHEEIRHTYCKV